MKVLCEAVQAGNRPQKMLKNVGTFINYSVYKGCYALGLVYMCRGSLVERSTSV